MIGGADLALSPAYRRATRLFAEPWAPALAGGEDYELVVALPPESLASARAAARKGRVPLTVNGRFVRGAACEQTRGELWRSRRARSPAPRPTLFD
jgi:thiamine monophosphate kinase